MEEEIEYMRKEIYGWKDEDKMIKKIKEMERYKESGKIREKK